jgi:hypothetical protein
MTAFQAPLVVGVDVGIPTQDTRGSVVVLNRVTVSAGNKRRTVGFEQSSTILGVNYVASGVSSNADKGVSLFVGTSAAQAAYATQTNIKGTLASAMALTQGVLDTGSNALVVEGTCSGASAADWVEGKLHVLIRSAKRI